MSSTPSNLTVPQSQNTAPVIKFRCLYTYDLRRKAKRWQDGFLRFHTFNKRVMVYDNPGNFIGDLHWRQDGGIQDGDEFELDKGVMVEVCESMEKTETDLSKLFEKKTPKESQPTQASNQSLRLSTPLSSTPSQSRPQASLSHLLGIKRTSIGQIASPYQARNSPTQRGDSSERAPKRPRFLPGERAEKPRETSKASPVAINLSEPSPPPGETPPVRPRRDPEIKSSTNLSKRNPVPTRESNRNEKPPSTSNPAPLSTLRPKNPMPETQINTLRLSTDKPRRKLMYQALLPPQASKPPEPVESGKRPNPFSDNQPQKTETGSSNHLLTGTEYAPSASTQVALDMIGSSVQAASGVVPRRLSPQKGLRKSFSDPTALTGATGIQSRRPGRSTLGPIDEGKSDQGPWTAEAMDLFDFWPPGRPKPKPG